MHAAAMVVPRGQDERERERERLSDIDHLEETLEVCEAEEAKVKAELEEQECDGPVASVRRRSLRG